MSIQPSALKKLFFSGIGGSGMSALAQVLVSRGVAVSGSDRRNDRGESPALFGCLAAQGISLFPQDGSGVSAGLDGVVVSAAVEQDTPDYARARELGLAVIPRPALLAALVNTSRGVCFSGTSGKSSATALCAYALTELGFSPALIAGADLVNYRSGPTTGNALAGKSDLCVVESCESDGTIVDYYPAVGVILNIERDHHELDSLARMFATFAAQTRETLVLNADCPNVIRLPRPTGPGAPRVVTFSAQGAPADYSADGLELGRFSSRFRVKGVEYHCPLPGLYNVSNALAALAAAEAVGARAQDFARVLTGFRGTARRFQLVGEAAGVSVIDDFAHNPAKVRAVLGAFESWTGLGRLFVVFQPHGYGPLRFQFEELVEVFGACLRPRDVLILPEVYYAGGTASRDISSADLAKRVSALGREAVFFADRAAAAPFIAGRAVEGDVVLVLGARDDSLTAFAGQVLERLKSKVPGDNSPLLCAWSRRKHVKEL
ncbi:Mur ligase domain-containing protein [bacterium]|nr:Mur ligase domain-containing protein [bacterium]